MKLFFAGLLAGLFLVSCSLQDRDLAPPVTGPSVTGVISGGSGKGKIYAVLYELDNNKKHRPVVDQLVGKNRRFEFPVASKSIFGVAAFEDLNGMDSVIRSFSTTYNGKTYSFANLCVSFAVLCATLKCPRR